MIFELIHQALVAHGFKKVQDGNHTGFYVQEKGVAIRFAVLHRIDELLKPGDLNSIINKAAPEKFLNDPSFRKNCDLICIHHLDKLADFKNREEQIFEIEEDPHYYKKYVLYYNDAEAEAIKGFDFEKLNELISDKAQFNAYKNNPTFPSSYSAAAKIFIKLPFLSLNFNKLELVPLRVQIDEAVAEEDLIKTHSAIKKIGQIDIEELMKKLISDELANIKN